MIVSNFNEEEVIMNLDRAIVAFGGFMVLFSLLLAQVHSPYWLWFTAFVGANLLQSSFTGFCPAASIFKFFGLKSGEAFK
jgi:hypothetical protein